MAKINLLPWREQLREERKQRFLISLAGASIVTLGMVFLAGQYLNGRIDWQRERNDFIRGEIALVDSRIAEINELRTRRQQLLERMKIIQDLQGNRPVIGHVFEQLVRTLPDGVYFTSVKMAGSVIAIDGAAESNSRISKLMREMDASDWLAAPNLTEVKATTAGALDQASNFQMTVQQSRPAKKVVGGAP